jgi:hypothetical protein
MQGDWLQIKLEGDSAMGMDMIAFIETCWPNREQFSGTPEDPAWVVAEFWPSRDYHLFDALADARARQMPPDDVPEYRAVHPARGVPPDLSRTAAMEYYDLIVGSELPDKYFWPPDYGSVTNEEEARRRVESGKAHYGEVAQTFNLPLGYAERTGKNIMLWRAVSKVGWLTPSWLYLREIHETLAANQLTEDRLEWDFRVILKALEESEKEIGKERVRLTFWFVY